MRTVRRKIRRDMDIAVFIQSKRQYPPPIALLLKVRTVTPPYLVESVPDFYSVDSIKAIILAIACALAGALFCIVLHNGEHYLKKWFPNPYVRVVAGAAGVIILYFARLNNTFILRISIRKPNARV